MQYSSEKGLDINDFTVFTVYKKSLSKPLLIVDLRPIITYYVN